MPKYVCDECGEVFQSKEELESHAHESSKAPRLQNLQIPSLSLRQIAVLFGVFLMATLFMGTVFFASSMGPSDQNERGTPASTEDTSPPTGYTVQSQGDIPRVSNAELPGSAVTGSEISHDAQVYLLTRPSVLLQYSCTGCQETVQNLSGIAKDYNNDRNWVYVAPYSDMDSKIAVTGFQRGPLKLEEVDDDRIGSFICSSLQEQPLQCAFR
ncbi:MAG: DUF3105 domain-containing protein [Candidatus Nanohaloarchaeota archaeon QJJ-7]|nr:DUF3105 domain-containing protein [Candidatus Nanohaloarchaeota archaeon QJJ-7]